MNEDTAKIDNKSSERLVKEAVEMRKEKGLTQRELSQLSGVNLSVISKMENGTSYPKLFTFLKVLGALDATLRLVQLKDKAEE